MKEDGDEYTFDPIITTNAGGLFCDVKEDIPTKNSSGNIILNQCGTLISRKDMKLKGATNTNYFYNISVHQQLELYSSHVSRIYDVTINVLENGW